MFGAAEPASTPNDDETTPDVSSYKNSPDSSPSMKRIAVAGDDEIPKQTSTIGESMSSNFSTSDLLTPKMMDVVDGAAYSVADSLNVQDYPIVIDTSIAAETNVR